MKVRKKLFIFQYFKNTKDLEAQNSKLLENEHHNQNFMNQANKIDQLERENRAFLSEITYLK